MNLAVINTPDNSRGFGNHHLLGSGSFMSCHDPYPTMQPWGPVSPAIGHFGAAATPMPQNLPVNPGPPAYNYPRNGGGSTVGSGPQAGPFQLPGPSYTSLPPPLPPPPPPAGPVTAPPGHGFAGGDYVVRDTAQDATTTTNADVHSLDAALPPPPPPTLAPIAGSVNPSDLSADRSNQARSVIVQIDGDVAKVLANKKEDVKPPKTTTPFKFQGISIAEGHSPTRGFSIDYFGLDERFKSGWAGRSAAPGGAPMPFKQPPSKVGWGDDGDKDPIFRCEICGLKWRGVVSTTLRGRNPAIWEDEHQAPVDNPTLKRARIEEFYFYLADVGGDPCIKGITMYGDPHPSYRPMPNTDPGLRKGVVEQDCCPPLCNRRLPPHVIDCVFDNCPFVNRSHAELRKHLLKKHSDYIKGLITKCEEERPMDDCDRAVCHFLMRSFAGLDAAGKRKISDPKRTVLSPDEMSNPAAYEEHCEWITYVSPRLEAPIIEFRTDEDGQAWQLTYTMDPGSRGPKMERIDPITRMPLPGGGKKRRRIR